MPLNAPWKLSCAWTESRSKPTKEPQYNSFSKTADRPLMMTTLSLRRPDFVGSTCCTVSCLCGRFWDWGNWTECAGLRHETKAFTWDCAGSQAFLKVHRWVLVYSLSLDVSATLIHASHPHDDFKLCLNSQGGTLFFCQLLFSAQGSYNKWNSHHHNMKVEALTWPEFIVPKSFLIWEPRAPCSRDYPP